MTYLKRTLATFAAAFPMWAMAHPGHEQQNSFLIPLQELITSLWRSLLVCCCGQRLIDGK